VVEVLQPAWLIGVGAFAAQHAARLFPEAPPRVGRILHPSPASPAANQGWSRQALAQLESLGVWRD
jgi:single-strand selective monofunctional uracil DNA glycosylase